MACTIELCMRTGTGTACFGREMQGACVDKITANHNGFYVLDDAKLLNILLDGMGLGSHERVDKFVSANGHTHAFQARHSDDIKLGFCKILFIEFTETLERGVVFYVLERKFASSLSGDRM